MLTLLLQETLVGKLLESIADRHPTRAEPFAELVLHQGGTSRDPSVHDVVSQPLNDLRAEARPADSIGRLRGCKAVGSIGRILVHTRLGHSLHSTSAPRGGRRTDSSHRSYGQSAVDD